jgi:putative hydrolase of the HAD superfamily
MPDSGLRRRLRPVSRGAHVIRAVLLDLDDTLFDHRHGARQALESVRGAHECFASIAPADLERRHSEILEALHLQVLAGTLRLDDARRERFRRLFEGAGVVAAPALVEAAAAAYRDTYQTSWREVRGATALLQALRGRARVGIVSNNLTREQHEKLRFCGFDAHLDAVVISEEAGVSKPDPAIFRIALERIGAAADETVMIGDAWRTDIAGARAAGIRAIWFNPQGRPRPEPWPDVDEIASLEPASVVLARVFGE